MGNAAATEGGEIIIKCTLEEMVKHFFKDYVVIWHDPNVNSPENQKYIMQLKQFCEVLTFTEYEKALASIQESKAACHVITSGTNGEVFVEEIYESSNVAKIYIFCMNKEYHSTWAKKYQKVSCVETNIQTLINHIKQNLLEWYREISSLKVNLPAFAPIFNDGDKSQMNHLHRYLKVISSFKNRSQAKTDFLNLSKLIYTDPNNTKLITDFEKYYIEYNKTQILRWYTRESFLYKVTNNCLRIATADSIQYCRLLLKDLEQAVKEQYQTKSKSFSGLLYRGANLSDKEWLNLKENLNKEIEMHGFLSVSKEKNVALTFMQTGASQKVLITIIVPKGPNEEEQGFAEIEEYSLFPYEREILFNVRSRFTVLETEEEYSHELSYRHLVLLYGAQGLRKFTAEQNPIIKVPIPHIQDISCCHCTQGTTESFLFRPLEKQIYYCKNCVHHSNDAAFLCIPLKITPTITEIDIKGCLLKSNSNIPFYGYKCSQCQAKKQARYFICTDCSKLVWCESCFTESIPCLQAQHTILLETHPFSFWCEKMSENESSHLRFQNETLPDHAFRQGAMYFESNKYDKVIEYYSLYIQQNTAKNKDRSLAIAYNNIGATYLRQREPEKALECHLKGLEIQKALLRENHPHIAVSYNNIGNVYNDQQKYDQALEYYSKGLNLRKSISGEHHFEVARAYSAMGSVYESQKEYDQALKHFLKALEIFKLIRGEKHPEIAIEIYNLGGVYQSQGEYNQALEYFLKALEMLKSFYGENDPNVATSYDSIGGVYELQREYAKALEYRLKCLGVKRLLYGENSSCVFDTYSKVGSLYEIQGQYDQALEYYFKALEIGKLVHGEKHSLLATTYSDIAGIYCELKEFTKALEYYLQCLELRKSLDGENDPWIVHTYSSIAGVYEAQGEYDKALDYYLKTLETGKPIYGEKHPDIANTYSNIADVYVDQKEFSKALEYYLQCLNIEKSFYGENNPNVASSYGKIGNMYNRLKEYSKALEYQLKALEIRKSLYGENHADVATSYNHISMIYFNTLRTECINLDILKTTIFGFEQRDDPLQIRVGRF